MAQTVLHVGLLLVVLCVADCESATPEDSHCSYTFIVPAGDCRQTPGEDQLLKSSLIALQAQVKLLAWQLRNAPVDIVKLVNDVNEVRKENAKLRQKIAVIEAGAVRGSNISAVNLKQCSMRPGGGDHKEHGLILLCAFVKKRDDTVLRVVWNGGLRLTHTGPKGSSCRRWFFSINGQECSEPRTIDAMLTVRTRGTNVHRPAYVEGYCRGVGSGHLNVAWNVGDCTNQNIYNDGDSDTGYGTTSRIIVEEVAMEDGDTAIV